MPAVISKMIERAVGGDMVAAQALARLAIPAVRPTEEPVQVALPTGQSLTEQGAAVLEAVARGEIGPLQGQALLSSLADLAKLRESDDHERRLRALEEQQQGAPTWQHD